MARAGIGTGDTTIFSRVLYQLSYLARLASFRKPLRFGNRFPSAAISDPGIGGLVRVVQQEWRRKTYYN